MSGKVEDHGNMLFVLRKKHFSQSQKTNQTMDSLAKMNNYASEYK